MVGKTGRVVTPRAKGGEGGGSEWSGNQGNDNRGNDFCCVSTDESEAPNRTDMDGAMRSPPQVKESEE